MWRGSYGGEFQVGNIDVPVGRLPQDAGRIAAYLTEAFETDDAAYIHSALETVGLCGGSKLEFEAVRKSLNSLGVRLVAEPIEGKKKSA
jgi:hypothetical protein